MPNPLRFARLALTVCAALAGAPRSVAAEGEITVAGATIAAGSAATVQGSVVIAPSAPQAPGPAAPRTGTAPGLGTPPAAPAAFPSDLPGGPDFRATSDATLPGGTIDARAFAVDAGVTLTFTGAVTIRATSDVTIAGTLRTDAADASIRILCGGDFVADRVQAPSDDLVVASGARSDVTIEAAGDLLLDGFHRAGADALRRNVLAARDLRLVQHAGGGRLTVQSLELRSAAGSIDVVGAQSFESWSVDLSAPQGSVAWSTFAGGAYLSDATVAARALTVTSAHLVSAGLAADVAGPVRIVGHGGQSMLTGRIDVAPSGQTASSPGVDVEIGGQVLELRALTLRHHGRGDVRVRSTAQTYVLTEWTLPPTEIRHEGTGDVRFHCPWARIYRGTLVRAADGDVEVEPALSGDFGFVGGSRVECPNGALRVTTERLVLAPNDPPLLLDEGFGSPTFDVAAAELDATGPLRFDVSAFAAGTGGFALVARADAAIRGRIRSAGPLRVATTAPSIVLAALDAATLPATGATSPIRVESFGGPGATIDLAGATLRTGDSSAASSGSILVAVRTSGDVAPREPVDGCVVPTSVRVRRDARRPERSTVTLVGTLDTGGSPVDLAGAASISFNGETRTLDLAADRRGRLRFSNPAVRVTIVPAADGSSRHRLSARLRGDPAAIVDAAGEGSLALRFATDVVDAACAVRLTRGRYRPGAEPQSLLAPALGPVSATAVVRDGAPDELRAELAISPEEEPSTPPRVSLAFGNVLALDPAPEAFREVRPGVFETDGAVTVRVDRRAGRILVRARGVELGAVEAGAALQVQATLGDDVRTLRMRLGARRGERLRY